MDGLFHCFRGNATISCTFWKRFVLQIVHVKIIIYIVTAMRSSIIPNYPAIEAVLFCTKGILRIAKGAT